MAGKKGKFTEEQIIVQTSVSESVNKYIEKLAEEEMLKRSDILRRWVMKCYKEHKELHDE